MEALYQRLRDFIEIPSITGQEGDYAQRVASDLRALGLGVELQEVAPGRCNVLARAAEPVVVLCTHLDTVPPYFRSSEDREHVHGRGACDAKGQAVAMIEAVRRLLASGEERVGLLLTVGEETTSDGAAHADRQRTAPWSPRYLVVGEPTDSRFVAAHKGIYKAKLRARGVSGHSSQSVGPSAVHELVRALARMLDVDLGEHPLLGRGTLNIGCIHGGLAANVVAPEAEAEILVRTVDSPERIRERLQACLAEQVELHSPFKSYGPIEFLVPDGEQGTTVAFGTDTPHLPHWGRPLLFGCGSILDAHTEHEKVGKRELVACAERHVRLATELLARAGAPA